MNEGYDLNRFRTFPLPLKEIFSANILSAILDINVLLPIVTFMAVFSAARPSGIENLWGFLIIIYFLLFIIISGQTLVTTLYVLLPRLDLVKVAVALLVLLLIWSALLVTGTVGSAEGWFNFFVFFRPFGVDVFRPYPNGQIGIALYALLEGRFIIMWTHLGLFSIWFSAVLCLNYILHAYWMENDVRVRVRSAMVKPDDVPVRFLNFIEMMLSRFVDPVALAVYRKDMLEFAFRSQYFIIFKFLPGTIAPVIIAFAMKWNLSPESGLITNPEAKEVTMIIMVILILFIVIAQANLFAGNMFGMEEAGIKSLLALPSDRMGILLGKNLFFGGLFLVDAIVVSAISQIYFQHPAIFFMTLSLLVTIMILIITIGNFTSVIWPYWMPLDKASFTLRSTIILSLINTAALVCLSILISIPLVMVMLPIVNNLFWVAYLMMPVSVLYAIVLHKLSLPTAVNLFKTNEFLLLRRIADKEEL
jgi:hypothetical protein